MTNLTKHQKEIALVLLSSLFFIVLAAYAYFMVYAPVKAENEQVKLILSNEREVMVALRKQGAASGTVDTSARGQCSVKCRSSRWKMRSFFKLDKRKSNRGVPVQDIQFSQGEFVIQNPPEQVGNVPAAVDGSVS